MNFVLLLVYPDGMHVFVILVKKNSLYLQFKIGIILL